MNLTKEQAAQITDLESYKKVTGAKRFKRSKEETDRGLTPEKALQERLEIALGEKEKPKPARKPVNHNRGDIVLRPTDNSFEEYFEELPNKAVKIELDDKWYGWFITLLANPYEGDANKLMRDIMDLGIGEVLTTKHFPEDIK